MLTTKPKGLYQPSETFLMMSSKTGLEARIMVQLLMFGSAFVDSGSSVTKALTLLDWSLLY